MFAQDFCHSQIECSELAEQCDSSNPQSAIRNPKFFPVYPDWILLGSAPSFIPHQVPFNPLVMHFIGPGIK